MFNKCVEKNGDQNNSIEFWKDLLEDLIQIIEEDQFIYTPIFHQFSHELNVGELSAETLWIAYQNDLKIFLENQATTTKIYKTSDYLNLFLRVKKFYLKYIANLNNFKSAIPEFSEWFVPFIMEWLNENDEHSMDILRNAYNFDKSSNFPQISQHANCSSSVVDIFTQLNETHKFLMQINCPDHELSEAMMHEFAKTLDKVLFAYVDMVQKDFNHFSRDEKISRTLLNNIQELSIQLEKICKNMGELQIDSDVSKVLTNLKIKLTETLIKMETQYLICISMERLVI